jgi:ariadne-1
LFGGRRSRSVSRSSFFRFSTYLPPCHGPPSAVTTPPQTRKRKALEAAIEDNEVSAATPAVESSRHTAGQRSSSKLRRTSKAEDKDKGLGSTAGAGDDFPVSLRKRVSDLATPATTAGSMDSDDDFMSDASSQDFLDTQGSDDESLGEGKMMWH